MMIKTVFLLNLILVFLCQSPLLYAKSGEKKNIIKPIKRITLGANQNFTKKGDSLSVDSNQKIKAEGSFYTCVLQNKDTDKAWGISLYALDFGIPLTLKWGNLSVSGSISKLKNPQFSSTISAFGAKTVGASTIFSSLPSAASSKKQQWLFGTLFMSPSIPKSPLTFSLCGFFNTDKSKGLSVLANYHMGIRKNLAFSSTIFSTQTFHDDNDWYALFPYFTPKQMLFQNYQVSFLSPVISTKINFNIFQNPIFMEKFAFTCGLETTLLLSPFLLNLGAFGTNSNSIWTAMNSQLKTFGQIKINPQYTTFLCNNNIRLKVGLCFLAEEKLWDKNEIDDDTEQSESNESQQNLLPSTAQILGDTLASAKIQAGLELATKEFFFSTSAQAEGLTLGKRFQDIYKKHTKLSKEKILRNGKYQIQLKCGWKNNSKPVFAASYSFERQKGPDSGLLKQSIQWNPLAKKNLCAKISSELTLKDAALEKTLLQSSLKLVFNLPYLRLESKIGFSLKM